jgi:protein-S-isoprenylcysteine O-methyltransferase Ste14
MNEQDFFDVLLVAWFALAPVILVSLFFITAPYGRYTRPGWGPVISSRTGWILMELPAAAMFALFFLLSERTGDLLPVLFLILWEIHYLHRSLVYPFRLRSRHKITLVTVALGVIFNLGNTYLNGRYLFTLGPAYSAGWLDDPRFITGGLLFAAGFVVNKHSDWILRRLRRPGDSGYSIPRGGLYRWVSCPNYLGEIIEWIGWAVATWSLAGLSFAVWTFANLAPRAWQHHRWYLNEFPDYPGKRKAVIPFLL